VRRNGLAGEKKKTLGEVLRDIDEFLEEPVAEERVESESELRRLVKITGRPRVLLVRELERAEAYRSGGDGRAFEPPPTLGTLLRLARLEVSAAQRKAAVG
jgi:hypothetical protein